MKSSQIQGLNKAIVVMRHFVDLSAKLLPFLQEINEKDEPTVIEAIDREKILNVYKQYKFDTSASQMLMDSDVLLLIQRAYERLEKKYPAEIELAKFRMEYDRLQKNWTKIDSN